MPGALAAPTEIRKREMAMQDKVTLKRLREWRVSVKIKWARANAPQTEFLNGRRKREEVATDGAAIRDRRRDEELKNQ